MKISRLVTALVSVVPLFGLATGVALAAPTLDQQFDGGNPGGWAIIQTNLSQAQSFTSGISGALTRVDVNLVKYGTPTAALVLDLRDTSSSLPSGASLGSATVTASDVQAGGGWVTFTFTTPPTVVAGTEYALMLTSTTTSGNQYGWAVAFASYSGTRSLSSSTGYGAWTADVTSNSFFRTYVNSPDSGPTPPPVLQQFGMPASGTCDAAAPIVLNWGGAGSGNWGNSWAEWVNGGKGGAVCTRTLSYSNALGHWVAS